MDAQEALRLLRDVRDCAFATVDERGNPHVRSVDVMIVEDGKLYFCTSRGKEFHHQLTRSGRVAITGLNSQWQTVRIAGAVRKLDDQRFWIDRIFDENPSMNAVYPGKARYILDAFCIDAGQMEFFDLGTEPIYRERIDFGEDIDVHGFKIGDECIGCGLCASSCPQHCIAEGVPYCIEPAHCLHCGLCYENCPVNAIASL